MDEQSLGYQLLNVVARQSDDLWRQVAQQGMNYFVPTANLDDIDVVYKFRLARSFNFVPSEDAGGVVTFRYPTVTGRIGTTPYTIASTSRNNIEDFWYLALPNRLTRGAVSTGRHVIVAAGTSIGGSPLLNTDATVFPGSGVPYIPSRLWVTLAGGTTYLSSRDNIPLRGLVRLTGLTRANVLDSELIIFLHDGTQSTTKEWQRIDRVDIHNIEPSGAIGDPRPPATIRIEASRFNDGPYEDFYNFEHSKHSKELHPTFLNVRSYTNSAGGALPVLEKINYIVDSFFSRISEDPGVLPTGSTLIDREVVKRAELLDEAGVVLPGVRDMKVQPFSTRIWVLDTSNRVHIYDRYWHYPNLGAATAKNYDANCFIEVLSHHEVLNNDLVLEFFQGRLTKTPVRHRVYLQRPDGSKAVISETGTLDVWSPGGGFVFTAPVGRILRTPATVRLSQRGDWIFTLEVRYADNSSETDQRIVSVESKRALRTLDLTTNGFPAGTYTGLSFDSDQKLWVLDVAGTKHELVPHYDVMLVDFNKKIIFFREPFDQVSVVP